MASDEPEAASTVKSKRSDVKSAPRQRKWATKSRTGCQTCRVRRVKCDEQKPVCTPCRISSKECEGYFYGIEKSTSALVLLPPKPAIRQLTQTPSPKSIDEPISSPPLLSFITELPPQHWDLAEAMRYHGVVGEYVKIEQIIPIDFSLRIGMDATTAETVVATVLNHRILELSRASTGNLPIWSKDTEHLWTALYIRLQRMLKFINKTIQTGPAAYNSGILYHILHMTTMEAILGSKTWRLHREGFYAYIQSSGGLQHMLDNSEVPARRAVQRVMIDTFVSNAFAPASDQINGIAAFPHKQIMRLYSKESEPNFPCPTVLFSHFVSLTRIRLRIASGMPLLMAQPQIEQILDGFINFNPTRWRELEYPLPDNSKVHQVGRIFRLSMLIFALATLPTEMTQKYRRTDNDLVYLGAELTKLIREGWIFPYYEGAMAWPLSVAGFAVAHGEAADRETVSKLLMDVFMFCPGRCAGAMEARIRILGFWRSGKTAWEDCWGELFKLLE